MTVLVAVAALGPLGHDAAEVRARAEELLSRPPFADGRPGPFRRLLQLVGDAVAGFLTDLFGEAVGTGVLPWIVVVLGVLLLGWLVWRITRGLSVDRSVAEVPVEIRRRSADDWHADADAAEGRGELREALRYRYAAMVATLLEGEAIEERPGRTVRELDAEVASAMPRIAEEVAAAGACFDAAVYGRREVTREELEVVARAARLVRGQVGRSRIGVPR